MTKPLSAGTIAVVRASVPTLATHGTAISAAMYARLFKDEHIRALFNQANQGEGGKQVHALAAAILAYAQNIESLDALMPAVERIAHKHIGYHILPEHYPFVASALIGALEDVLGEAATPALLAAWDEAYWFLANVLQAREGAIRAGIERDAGGWHGWRAFRIARKIRESAVITSFELRPADGGTVIAHRPGQYLTLRLDRLGSETLKRNYSISSGPSSTSYRITVKREPLGAASRWLHDHLQEGDVIEATPPAGDFMLAETPPRPVILLSGGVGLTPMVSMVEHIAIRYPELETHYIHGAISSETHAMDAHVRRLASRHGRMRVTTFYSDPADDDAVGTTHDVDGMITADWLGQHTPLIDADVYLCGPKPFLRALVADVSLAGVPADRVHYEFFGPAEELLVV